MENPLQDGTRGKLFRAGASVFAREGYRGATVREICRLAGAANVSSINYYFGGKEGLYKAILDVIFSEYGKHRARQAGARQGKPTAQERLWSFIRAYCEMLYQGAEVDENMRSIFMAEMSRPTPYLGHVAEKYGMPMAGELMEILQDLLGPTTPAQVMLDCAVSIAGAIGYYSVAWPLFSRMFPQLPDMRIYYTVLADHVYRYSLGGLNAIKKSLTQSGRARTRQVPD